MKLDNDDDDDAGTLELNLNDIPLPAKRASGCKLSQLPDVQGTNEVKTGSLFEMKRLRGFWPCYNDETGERALTVRQQSFFSLAWLWPGCLRPREIRNPFSLLRTTFETAVKTHLFKTCYC